VVAILLALLVGAFGCQEPPRPQPCSFLPPRNVTELKSTPAPDWSECIVLDDGEYLLKLRK
jgi:hypothetical protein